MWWSGDIYLSAVDTDEVHNLSQGGSDLSFFSTLHRQQPECLAYFPSWHFLVPRCPHICIQPLCSTFSTISSCHQHILVEICWFYCFNVKIYNTLEKRSFIYWWGRLVFLCPARQQHSLKWQIYGIACVVIWCPFPLVIINLVCRQVVHKVSKNLGTTSKFKMPEGWQEASSVQGTLKY